MKVSRSFSNSRRHVEARSPIVCHHTVAVMGIALFALLVAVGTIVHQTIASMDDEDLVSFAVTRKMTKPLTSSLSVKDAAYFDGLGRDMELPTIPDVVPYDIFDCPDTPPPQYPYEWNALQVLDHWAIDDVELPRDYLHQGLCVFDWTRDGRKIEAYRQAEVPFVLQRHPEVLATATRWSTPGYLHQLLGTTKQTSEHSQNNHFMFWRPTPNIFRQRTLAKQDASLARTTDDVELSFPEWWNKASELEHASSDDDSPQEEQEHWYFRINGRKRDELNLFLYNELPFFNVETDTDKDNEPASTLFMINPLAERGINCRFGMKGIFAALHFDSSRNWITVLGGKRRYLLSSYRQCSNWELFPAKHPSGRHSRVNWSHPREELQRHPEWYATFGRATMNEVVLQAGDALYLPTSWFHAIVSLNTNFQCNARSGTTTESYSYLNACGFGPPRQEGVEQ